MSKKEEILAERNKQQQSQRVLSFVVIGIAALLIAVIFLYPNLKPAYSGLERRMVDNNTTGDPNAPVKVVEYSDFQCPYCGEFFKTIEPDLIKEYINTGKVYFTYNSFAFLGEESHSASEAGECAKEQGKFWPYHDILFENQAGENSGAFTRDKLKMFARELKLDEGLFGACIDSGKYTQIVTDMRDATNDIGINSTPSFLVNGQPVADPTQLIQAIKAALPKAG